MFNQQYNLHVLSAGPVTNHQQEQEDLDGARPPKRRLQDTHAIVESLYNATLRLLPGEKPAARKGQRRNRNEVYALANAILVKEIHLNGLKYSRDIELSKGIYTNVNRSEFLLVLRTDGRIVVMSEEAERHLGKSMRSLYAQCINMFDCLNSSDQKKLRHVLDSSAIDQGQEHQLVCTFRLPKGKRPSRAREDIKTITMAGHFYSCHDPSSSSSSSSYEKLFVARCEALISRTSTTGTSSSSSEGSYVNTNCNTTLEFTLNDDMSIHSVSSNVEDILGYRRHELVNTWFGRYITSEDLPQLENNRQKSYQQEQSEQKLPANICDIFDIYTKDGEGRLTFLYHLRPIRTRKTRAIKYQLAAQLIDPAFRNEYQKYIEPVPDCVCKKNSKAEQVNLVPSSASKSHEDGLVAYSPSLSRGLLVCDTVNNAEFIQPQYSPIDRSLSNVVGPVDVIEQYWPDGLFSFEHEQYPIEINFSFEPTMDYSDQCQTSEPLNSNYFDPYLIDDFAF